MSPTTSFSFDRAKCVFSHTMTLVEKNGLVETKMLT